MKPSKKVIVIEKKKNVSVGAGRKHCKFRNSNKKKRENSNLIFIVKKKKKKKKEKKKKMNRTYSKV